jgi:hypothetical protein
MFQFFNFHGFEIIIFWTFKVLIRIVIHNKNNQFFFQSYI